MYRKDLVKANLEMLDLSSILNIKIFSKAKLTSLKLKKKKLYGSQYEFNSWRNFKRTSVIIRVNLNKNILTHAF